MKYKGSRFIVCLIFCLVVLYISASKTYTAYESTLNLNASNNIAKWQIQINQKNINDYYEKSLELTDITWTNTHTRENTLSPGSKGLTVIEIEPSLTEVAVRYDISYDDATTNSENILTITNVSDNEGELVQTGAKTYSGIFSLNEIVSFKKKLISIELEWIENSENNERDSQIGREEIEASFANISFTARQYQGEELVPYSP